MRYRADREMVQLLIESILEPGGWPAGEGAGVLNLELQRGELSTPRSILIIQLTSIGDVVMTTPVIEGLRERYPEAYIAFLVDEPSLDVVRNNPFLDEVIIGVAPRVFNQLKIPYASWFIDEPDRCLDPFRHIDRHELTRLCIPFVCDRAYIEYLKRFGFEDVYYLPLAANPSIFREMELSVEDERRYSCNISFVGGSDIAHYRKYCLEPKDRRIQILIDEVIKAHIQSPERLLHEILDEREKGLYYTLSFKDESQKRRVLLGLEFAAMTRFRKEMMEVVSDLGLVLYGDKGWQEVIDDGIIQFKGWIDNRKDLPKLYNASRINLNISTPQRRTAIPPRIFDIIACGGFVLTDYLPELKEFFEIDKELAVYKNIEELNNKVEYYLNHPEERQEIAGLVRSRVLSEHTYEKRMEELLSIFKGYFAYDGRF